MALTDVKPFTPQNYNFANYLANQGYVAREDGTYRRYNDDGNYDRLAGDKLREMRDTYDPFREYDQALRAQGYMALAPDRTRSDRGLMPESDINLLRFRERGMDFTQPFDPLLYTYPGSSLVNDSTYGQLLKFDPTQQVRQLPDINPEHPFQDFLKVAGAAFGGGALLQGAGLLGAQAGMGDFGAEAAAFGSAGDAAAVNEALAGLGETAAGGIGAGAGMGDFAAEAGAFGSTADVNAINAALGGMGETGGSMSFMSQLSDIASKIFGGGDVGIINENTGLSEILKKLGISNGGPLSTLASIASGIYGMNRAGDMRDLALRAMQEQDPFGPERAQYAAKLRELYANPSNVENLPGYKAGLQAIERSMAGNGYLGSGNMMLALHDYGGRMFDAEAQRLAQLAGAQFGPSGGGVLLSGNNLANTLANESLGSLGYGVRGIEDLLRRAF